jgi:S-adenosylmethionine:tRNA ribosyltransferase-isomerase
MTVVARGDRTADYDFVLPAELIAQAPVAVRDESRLMIVDRATQSIRHGVFRDIVDVIPSGDVVVANRSRVIKARLLGTRAGGGSAEVLLLEPRDGERWEALVRPSARLKPGQRVQIAPSVHVVCEEATGTGSRIVRFDATLPVERVLERYGHMPLPPYITRGDEATDAERYQTVYAAEPGSVAAPTAGLHFTPPLLDALQRKQVRWESVLLHVGAGTFKPIEHDDPAEHPMHRERFTIAVDTADTLSAARREGRGIWAVGTTSLRVLESVVQPNGAYTAATGSTDIFIRPPHVVRGADHLITNFHLPRSTLLMLVAAFAGYDLMMTAYATAIAEGYRFYSYGDAMCIV